MQPCPNGSRQKPNADPEAGVLYYKDLNFPTGVPSFSDSPFSQDPDRGWVVDLGMLATRIGLPQYGGLNILHYKDISGFCEQPPTIDDVPPAIFEDAPLNEFVRRVALHELQRRWRDNCECMPRPDCEQFGGLGQCNGIPYEVRFRIFGPWDNNRRFFDVQSGLMRVYGGMRWEWVPNLDPGGTTYRWTFLLRTRGQWRYNSSGQIVSVQGPQLNNGPLAYVYNPLNTSPQSWPLKPQALANEGRPGTPPSVQVIEMRRMDGGQDNCCEPPIEPQPDPLPPPPVLPNNLSLIHI